MSESECIQVAVRIRPLVPLEMDRGYSDIVTKTPNEPQIILNKKHIYSFNYVYSQMDSQKDVYTGSIYKLLDYLFQGFNVTILAYGQTGSGKTHTMGTNFDGSLGDNMGVIPRTIMDIFSRLKTINKNDYKITCSFVELYQEKLYDLLSDNQKEKNVLDIREDPLGGVYIPGLTEKKAKKSQDIIDSLIAGGLCRTTGSTAMNEFSSRSHSIFTINLEIEKGDSKIKSKFYLVDLAGSERSSKTKATGDRFKEGVQINKGLLALSKVISTLGSGNSTGYIGYRDSKLTRLLQDSLGGNSKTLMIACISPANSNFEETLNTLRYADQAKKIKNKPIINCDVLDFEISKLKDIIQSLELKIKDNGGNRSAIESEKIVLEAECTEIDMKSKTLQKELRDLLLNIATIEQRLDVTENVNIVVINKIEYLKKIMNNLDISLFNLEICPAEILIQNKKISDFRTMFNEICNKLDTTHTEEDLILHDVGLDGTQIYQADQKKVDNFRSKQLVFTNELKKMNIEISQKSELYKKHVENQIKAIDAENEKLKNYIMKYDKLEKERNELSDKFKNSKVAVNIKIAEQRRLKVKELAAAVVEMKKKIQAQQKVLQLKKNDASRIENLEKQIIELKKSKKKMLNTMRNEAKSFENWKLNKDKEINLLKQNEKQQSEKFTKIQTSIKEEEYLLKKKISEANEIKLRLKTAIENKQKHVKFDKKWFENEIEILISITDAKFSVKLLMEDRARMITKLRNLNEEENPNKNQINDLEIEIEVQQQQITDLQEKILASETKDPYKDIIGKINTMSESRNVIENLINKFISLTKESIKEMRKFEYTKLNQILLKNRIEKIKQDINNLEIEHEKELKLIKNNYEEKTNVLLRERNSTETTADDSLFDELDRLQIEIMKEEEMIQYVLEEIAFADNFDSQNSTAVSPDLFEYSSSPTPAKKKKSCLRKCSCKLGCLTMRCTCKKNNRHCSDCNCNQNCANKTQLLLQDDKKENESDENNKENETINASSERLRRTTDNLADLPTPLCSSKKRKPFFDS